MPLVAPKIKNVVSNQGRDLIIADFKRGYNSFLNNVRRSNNSLDKAINMMTSQDGTVKKRWGTRNYGSAIPGEICDGDGKFARYNKQTGQIEDWLISVVDGFVYVSRTGFDWQKVAGGQLTVGKEADFLNIESKVFIANGYDNLSFYDIEQNRLFKYQKLPAVKAPRCALQGTLATGSITLNYRISAVNDVGETVASQAGTIKVAKQRNTWINEKDKIEAIKLDWDAVDGASRYNIYYSDEAGQEVYIDSIAATTYLDDARSAPNIAIAAPKDDTTGGPIVKRLEYADNRIWGVGDPQNPYRVYFGGVGSMTTAFSPFYGGGWFDLAKGGENFPTRVKAYRDGKGDTNNTLFTSSANGEGLQYQVALSSMTVGTTTFIVPVIGQVIGSLGTSAAKGVVECKNNLFYPSVNMFNTTGAKPDMLNVLSTDEISLAIRPDVRSIGAQNASKIAAIYFDGKIFWAVARGEQYNNEIWILDMEVNTWMLPWKIPAKYFLRHTDEHGVDHLLFRPSVTDERYSGKYLVELSPRFQDDNGVLFDTHLSTGIISFDRSHMNWAKIDKVYLEMINCRGEFDVAISGAMKNKHFKMIKSFKVSAVSTSAGWDNQLWDGFKWDDAPTVAKVVLPETIKKILKVRKTVNNFKIEVTSKSDSSYELSVILAKFKPKKVSDPGAWKK